MFLKKRICALLSFSLLFSTLNLTQISYAEEKPYYGINISTDISGAMGMEILQDKIYVSENGNHKIVVMDKNGDNREDFATDIAEPIHLISDNDGNLYVNSFSDYSIIKIDADGNKTTIFNNGKYLTGMAIDSQNKLFVLECNGENIWKMNLDGSNPEIFATIPGMINGSSLAIDNNDTLYVTHIDLHGAIKIAPDASKSGFISSPTHINTIVYGDDGYMYTSNFTDNTIDKFDLSGNKVDSFAVKKPTYSSDVWDLEIDSDGTIYFVNHSSVARILGNSNTIDTQHIKVNFVSNMLDNDIDPNAFTLDGAASNPSITKATVSGNELTLTLDSKLSALDTALKLNYAPTGASDLTFSETSVKVNGFKNMDVSNKILNVVSVDNIPQINVENGTTLSQLELPTEITVNLSDSTNIVYPVVWDNASPEYNETTAGTYAFTGSFEITDNNISNPSNIAAHVNVAVGEVPTPNIDSVNPISDITVSNGTSVDSINFPSNVDVTLSNATTTSAAITWKLDETQYNSSVAGTYSFSGSLDASEEFLNPGNLMAALNVIVKPKEVVIDNNSSSKGGSSSSGSSSSSSGGGGGSFVAKPSSDDKKLYKEDSKLENGIKSVNISISKDALSKAIEEKTIKNDTLEIKVADNSATNNKVSLTGDIVKKLQENNFKLLISNDAISYDIDSSILDLSDIASKLNVSSDELQKVKFEIQINKFASEKQNDFNQKVANNNAKMLVEPIEFKIYATSENNNKTIEISKFDKYVERIFKAPNTLSADQVSTGVVFNSDLSYNPVPTTVFDKDGQLYIKISSLTNSTYAVISNPIKTNVSENHWAAPTINKLASKLIVTDTTKFDPSKKITRAELAEYLTRGLGIYNTDISSESKFKDISKDDPHFAAITIANNWGLISGYPDSTFKPNALVTREEAMAMYASVMEIANFEVDNNKSTSVNTSDVSKWALPSVIKVTNAQIFSGRTSTALDPKENLTHAEALAAIEKFLNNADLIN